LLRDLRVGVIRKMEFERAIWIDANIWKAQCKRASGAALMQSHFPSGQAINRRLGLVIRDIATNILCDSDRGPHRRRLKIAQYAPLRIMTRGPMQRARGIPENWANLVNALDQQAIITGAKVTADT
jgi:hypothetical protein